MDEGAVVGLDTSQNMMSSTGLPPRLTASDWQEEDRAARQPGDTPALRPGSS